MKGELKVESNIRKHVQPSGAKWAMREGKKEREKKKWTARGKSVVQV